eukprot:c26514_g1_i1.p1 GENE.c26514_g1_i1~~c26514_g1_i1.p1  ORF type:complete len:605 (-),score=176.97 c26514_g1_i1:128-1837(-)
MFNFGNAPTSSGISISSALSAQPSLLPTSSGLTFGSSQAFGFGATSQTGFGATSQTGFGATSQSAFGVAPITSQPLFASQGFGASAQPSPFSMSQPAAGGFGNTFGLGATTQQLPSLFGAAPAQPAFGLARPATTASQFSLPMNKPTTQFTSFGAFGGSTVSMPQSMGFAPFGGGMPQQQQAPTAALQVNIPVSNLGPEVQRALQAIDVEIAQHRRAHKDLEATKIDPAIDETSAGIANLEQGVRQVRGGVDEVIALLGGVKTSVGVLRNMADEASVIAHRIASSTASHDPYYYSMSSYNIHGVLPSPFFAQFAEGAAAEVESVRQRLNHVHDLVLAMLTPSTPNAPSVSPEALHNVLQLQYDMMVAAAAKVAAVHAAVEDIKAAFIKAHPDKAHLVRSNSNKTATNPQALHPWRVPHDLFIASQTGKSTNASHAAASANPASSATNPTTTATSLGGMFPSASMPGASTAPAFGGATSLFGATPSAATATPASGGFQLSGLSGFSSSATAASTAPGMGGLFGGAVGGSGFGMGGVGAAASTTSSFAQPPPASPGSAANPKRRSGASGKR